MTHEELVERVGRGLAHRHMLSSGTSEILHWSLFEDEAREAIRITGEALLAHENRSYGVGIGPRVPSSIIQSLTQGNTP